MRKINHSTTTPIYLHHAWTPTYLYPQFIPLTNFHIYQNPSSYPPPIPISPSNHHIHFPLPYPSLSLPVFTLFHTHLDICPPLPPCPYHHSSKGPLIHFSSPFSFTRPMHSPFIHFHHSPRAWEPCKGDLSLIPIFLPPPVAILHTHLMYISLPLHPHPLNLLPLIFLSLLIPLTPLHIPFSIYPHSRMVIFHTPWTHFLSTCMGAMQDDHPSFSLHPQRPLPVSSHPSLYPFSIIHATHERDHVPIALSIPFSCIPIIHSCQTHFFSLLHGHALPHYAHFSLQ